MLTTTSRISEESAPRNLEKLATAAFITLAMGVIASLPAHSAEVALNSQKAVSQPTAVTPQTLPNGTYLYGQSAQANQIGSTYLVFQVKDQQVVGGFYMPSSSFDCFHGNLDAAAMQLTVVNSYDRSSHPYAISLERAANVASVTPGSSELNLMGYNRIAALSNTDRTILKTCQADYQKALSQR